MNYFHLFKKENSRNCFNLHDFRSACRVRFRSRGAGRDPGAFVAVLTSDSKISSSPSVKFSSVCLRPNAGDRILSARRRRHVNVTGLSIAFSVAGFGLFGDPSNCLQIENK